MGSADDNDITLDKDEGGPNDMTVTMMQGGTFQVKVHSTKGIMVNGAVVTESIVAESGLVLENLDKQYKVTVCWFENGRYNRVNEPMSMIERMIAAAEARDVKRKREDSPEPALGGPASSERQKTPPSPCHVETDPPRSPSPWQMPKTPLPSPR